MPQLKKVVTKAPATVDAYIAAAPEERRRGLERLRKTIRAAAPAAIESVSYGIAGFKYKGKPLVYFGYWKQHLALYGLGARVIKDHAGELKPYEVAKGTIRFAAGVSAPAPLVRTLVKARVAEVDRGSRGTGAK
ncbi:MAG: DUF1801 domain-containing protein [Chloroflexota bacterium]|nr:DUF1801 domain-containing protein [Chloroflexota bacterium]